MPQSPYLQLSQLCKTFADQQQAAVQAVTMQVAQGDILALLGPSGCGKTTTLRMIAGFEQPDQGDIRLQGQSLLNLSTQARKIGMVFQDYALFPHLNIADNIGFGLHRLSKNERQRQAHDWLELVGLAGLGERMPQQLSGGQQQRVALARSLAPKPRLVLLDEPFSNLDTGLREQTRNEVRRLLKAAGATAILVTHDQAEALSFADQIGVMQAGRLMQLDSPERIYHRPANAFVAEFLGHTNLLPGLATGEQASTEFGPVKLDQQAHGQVTLSLRPEHLCLRAQDQGQGTILAREFRGHDYFYLVGVGQQQIKVISHYSQYFELGQAVALSPCDQAVVLGE